MVAAVAVGVGVVVAAVALVVALGSGGDPDPPASRAVQAPSGAVVAIDPGTGEVVGRTPVGATPSAVAVGAGAVWTVNADENSVSRVDLRTDVVRTEPADAIPLDIAAGEESAWLVTGGSNLRSVPPPARIDRLDAASGAPIASQPLTPRAGMPTRAPPQLVAAGAGGVWAIGRTGRLHRIDPVSGDVDAVRGLSAVRVAAGDDQVWVLIEPPPRRSRAENLVRLDPRDGRIAAGVRVPGRSLGALAVGAGGVWLTDSFNGSVWRVDPTLRALPRQIPVDPGVDAIAAADEGVWTANSVTGTVARIDTTRNAVSDKLDLGGAPRGIAIGAGRVWVTNVPAPSAPGAATSLRFDSRVEPGGLARLRPRAGRAERRPRRADRLRRPVRRRVPVAGRGDERGGRPHAARPRVPRRAAARRPAGVQRRAGCSPASSTRGSAGRTPGPTRATRR